MSTASVAAADIEPLAKEAKAKLDQHTFEIVQWHFHESTGAPFWLQKKRELKFDPLKEVHGFDDLKKFPLFEDDWLREGPVRKWVPKAYEDRPTFVFETGGTTGQPKRRIVVDDFRIDYEMFSDTLPDQYFPKGAN
jgi:phenylacetate-coenzyme A ligase PaaK-like adenylate-forming protein